MRVEQRGAGRRHRIEETWSGRRAGFSHDNEIYPFHTAGARAGAGALQFPDGVVVCPALSVNVNETLGWHRSVLQAREQGRTGFCGRLEQQDSRDPATTLRLTR